jgi:hypothetical protein
MIDLRRWTTVAVALQMAWAAPAGSAVRSPNASDGLLTIASDGFAWIAGLHAGAAAAEPQTWILLLGGFGLIGSTLRRRNRALERRQLV